MLNRRREHAGQYCERHNQHHAHRYCLPERRSYGDDSRYAEAEHDTRTPVVRKRADENRADDQCCDECPEREQRGYEGRRPTRKARRHERGSDQRDEPGAEEQDDERATSEPSSDGSPEHPREMKSQLGCAATMPRSRMPRMSSASAHTTAAQVATMPLRAAVSWPMQTVLAA